MWVSMFLFLQTQEITKNIFYMKKQLLLYLLAFLCAFGAKAADYVLNQELTWDQVKGGSVSFAIVSGSDVLYGSGNQNTGMAAVGTAVSDANGVSVWKVESISAGFMFRGYNMAGTAYRVFGDDGYLNAQPNVTGVSFILGKTKSTNGQDMENGAVWTVTSTSGGYYIKNVGSGAYLNGTNTSVGADKVWKFYSVKESAGSGSTPSIDRTALNKSHEITVNNEKRSYVLYVPSNMKDNPELVFSLHGANNSANYGRPDYKDVADNSGFVVVYPQGQIQDFYIANMNGAGWDATGENNKEIDFFKAIIEDVKSKGVNINAKKIYCSGFSNGGMMTYAASNAASDVFAAFASISGFPVNEYHLRHTSSRPVPFLHIHGGNDNFVNVDWYPTVRDIMVTRNGCNPVAKESTGSAKTVDGTSTTYTKYEYAAGDGGFPYIYYNVAAMGHNDACTIGSKSSSQIMWEFMSQYSLDSECDKTLKWKEQVDANGYAPLSHGWDLVNGSTLSYGRSLAANNADHNVYYDIQLEAGSYEIRVKSSGNNKITVKLETIGGASVVNQQVNVGTDATIPFATTAYGQYKITFTKGNTDDKLLSLGIYEASGSSSTPSGEGINLTASMFHEWTGIDASATVKTENVNGACELNASTGLPYGNSNVKYLYYADLSKYSKLEVTASSGEPRFCFNREVPNGSDENGGNVVIEYPRDKDSKKYETVTDNADGTKTYTINLAAIVKVYGYAHLNCIKGANWANVTVTSMKLYEAADSEPDVDPEPTPVPDGHTQLTANDFYEWTAADATGEKVKNTGCDYNLNVSTGTIYGHETINILHYADLSNVDKLYVVATNGVPRGIFNCIVQGVNTLEVRDESSPYLTIVDKGNGRKEYIFDIAAITDDYGYTHLHAIKAYDYQSSATVSSITYTMRTNFPSIPADPSVADGEVGDVNGNGEVSIEDLATLVDDLKNNTDNVRDDVNEDNRIDLEDVNSLSSILLGGKLEYDWVGTWTTAQQEVEPNNLPPSPGLSGNSLRQIVQVSVGGKKIRLKFSNEFGTEPTEIKAVEIALAKSSGATSFVYENTTKSLTFNGQSSVTIQPGKMIMSDPISYTLSPRDNVAITIHYGNCSNTSVTGHPGSRTTSYIKSGNSSDFSSADARTDHWYNICGIDVVANKDSRAVAILGNSITDGRGSTTNQQNRWADNFSRALLANESTKDVAVLNLGIGGNGVTGGLGPAAYARYDRDILQQAGVKYAIIFIGTNDVGGSNNSNSTYNTVTSHFTNWINKAHDAGIKIYGATITPFKGSGYYTTEHEALRKRINNWIRTCGLYDAVIDFDKIMQDPNDTESMPKKYFMDGTDGLHANAEGYLYMGNSIDLKLFENY